MESPADLMKMLGDLSGGDSGESFAGEKEKPEISLDIGETNAKSHGVMVQDITEDTDEPMLEFDRDDSEENFPSHFSATTPPVPPVATTQKAKSTKKSKTNSEGRVP